MVCTDAQWSFEFSEERSKQQPRQDGPPLPPSGWVLLPPPMPSPNWPPSGFRCKADKVEAMLAYLTGGSSAGSGAYVNTMVAAFAVLADWLGA